MTTEKKDVTAIDYRGTLFGQVHLDCSAAMQAAVLKHVDKADWNKDKDTPVEKESHVTIKLGLPTTLSAAQIGRAFREAKLQPFRVRVGGLGHFANDKQDVLFAKVDDVDGGLAAVRAALQPFEIESMSDTARAYHPHMTLVFLRPGAGAAYEKHEALLKDVQVGDCNVYEISFKIVGDKSTKPLAVPLHDPSLVRLWQLAGIAIPTSAADVAAATQRAVDIIAARIGQP